MEEQEEKRGGGLGKEEQDEKKGRKSLYDTKRMKCIIYLFFTSQKYKYNSLFYGLPCTIVV